MLCPRLSTLIFKGLQNALPRGTPGRFFSPQWERKNASQTLATAICRTLDIILSWIMVCIQVFIRLFCAPSYSLQSLWWESGNLGCICQPQAVNYLKVKQKMRGHPNLGFWNKYVGNFHEWKSLWTFITEGNMFIGLSWWTAWLGVKHLKL